MAHLFVKSLQKQEELPNSVINIYTTHTTEGVFQWSPSFTWESASLQYLHFSFPEALHPGEDSSQKPLDHPFVTSFILFIFIS